MLTTPRVRLGGSISACWKQRFIPPVGMTYVVVALTGPQEIYGVSMFSQMPLPVSHDDRPLFSVITTTFNRAALLPRALDSLLKQEETSWEAIIVDDGSTDDTFDVVRPYVQAHGNVRYQYHRNRQQPLSRNAGIAQATGVFVTFLDSDDWYAPSHLRRRREILDRYPSIGLLHGGYEVVGDPYIPDKNNPAKLLDLRQPEMHDLVVGGTFVLERRLLIDLGGFPLIEYGSDRLLYEKIQRRGLPIVRTTEPTYVYDRTAPDSMCNLVAQGGLDAINAYRNAVLS